MPNAESVRKTVYQWASLWVIFSPLIWLLVGQLDFVGVTLTVNAGQVVIIPVLVMGVWIITAHKKYIGVDYRNRWWEYVLMAFLFVLACLSGYFALLKMQEQILG